MTRKAKITQAEIRRRVVAVSASGLQIQGVKFDAKGEMIILTGDPVHVGTSWDDIRCDYQNTLPSSKTTEESSASAIASKAIPRHNSYLKPSVRRSGMRSVKSSHMASARPHKAMTSPSKDLQPFISSRPDGMTSGRTVQNGSTSLFSTDLLRSMERGM